jgi:hypothetical protein
VGDAAQSGAAMLVLKAETPHSSWQLPQAEAFRSEDQGAGASLLCGDSVYTDSLISLALHYSLIFRERVSEQLSTAIVPAT